MFWTSSNGTNNRCTSCVLQRAEHRSSGREFAEISRTADKIVYPQSPSTVSSAKTRIERTFDPRAIQELKTIQKRDITLGGPHLAAQAFKAGLMDEYQQFVMLVVLGGGQPSLPNDVGLECEPLSEHRFGGGVVIITIERRWLTRYRFECGLSPGPRVETPVGDLHVGSLTRSMRRAWRGQPRTA